MEPIRPNQTIELKEKTAGKNIPLVSFPTSETEAKPITQHKVEFQPEDDLQLNWVQAVKDKTITEKSPRSSDILIRLNRILSESVDGELKRNGDYELILDDTHHLAWIRRRNLLGRINEGNRTKELLKWVYETFIEKIKSEPFTEPKEFLNVFDKLMAIPILREALKDQKKLSGLYLSLLQYLLYGSLERNGEALQNFLAAIRNDVSLVLHHLSEMQLDFLKHYSQDIASLKKEEKEHIFHLLGYSNVFKLLSTEEIDAIVPGILETPQVIRLPTPRLTFISYDALNNMCQQALKPFLIGQKEMVQDIEKYINRLSPHSPNLIYVHGLSKEKIEQKKQAAKKAFAENNFALCLNILQNDHSLGVMNCIEYVHSALKYIVDKTTQLLTTDGLLSPANAHQIRDSVKAILKIDDGFPNELSSRLNLVKFQIKELTKILENKKGNG